MNASCVLNAYTCFARQTGCRPGMAVNDAADAADAAGHWFELTPLHMDSLSISSDALLGGEDGVLTEGGYRARCRMEVLFKRKKGEYFHFACYHFGMVDDGEITPDLDQMVRIGVVALIRLSVKTDRSPYADRSIGSDRLGMRSVWKGLLSQKLQLAGVSPRTWPSV